MLAITLVGNIFILHITQRGICYFVVFVNHKSPLFIEKIKRDDIFWQNNMEGKLTFYKCCILPEIIRGNIKRGLRCVDPTYIIDAQQERQRKIEIEKKKKAPKNMKEN
ncbi:hypothetical protein RN001_000552 [Aquatica leii]|uniref:Uncharacterized protein n=1 Tax=Aquatica leii TaxID=1421715 RepID=A0AAN7SCA6_9COLE|nr:hypothetical protein RN001_000552 [Aquatica leii]